MVGWLVGWLVGIRGGRMGDLSPIFRYLTLTEGHAIKLSITCRSHAQFLVLIVVGELQHNSEHMPADIR